jgi:hypothetical protein
MEFELKDDREAAAARGGSLGESLTSNIIRVPLHQANNEQYCFHLADRAS